MSLILASLIAAQPAAPAAEPDLDWLAGYWLSCEDGVEVSETWSNRRGGIMLGSSVTIGDDAFGWEQIRIEADGEGLTFHALPRGQSPAAFRLVRSGPAEAVFENPAHDFPNRVAYRREGSELFAEVSGKKGANVQRWRFRKIA